MTDRDPLSAIDALDGPGPRYVAAPAPHAGLGRALRGAFAPRVPVPDELDQLLGRLR